MTFKVYTIAWYVDVAIAQRDSELATYRGSKLPDLLSNEEFLTVMHSRGRFDRTLLIKLAMTLNKDQVIQGLVEELLLERRNAVR